MITPPRIVAAAACVAIAFWWLGFSHQGQPDHEMWADLASIGFMGAVVVALGAVYLNFENRRRSGTPPEDNRKSD